MRKQMVISVMSKDRTGIVADITGSIYDLEGDLADLNQSVLCGYFTMILIASFPEEITPEDVIARFSHIESETKLEVVVKSVDVPIDVENHYKPEAVYFVTASGKNQIGLVAKMGEFCLQHNINILDLDTTVSHDVYTMILQIDLSQVSDTASTRAALCEFGEVTGLKVVLQHEDIFKATNEI